MGNLDPRLVYTVLTRPRIYLKLSKLYVTSVWFEATPVVPGQPITIAWYLRTLKGSGLFPGTVTARIFLTKFNLKLYESQPTPLVETPFSDTTQDQQMLIAPLPAGGAGNELYKIGMTALRLEVTVDRTGAVFSCENDLQVVPDILASWEWVSAQGVEDSSAPTVPKIPLMPQRYYFVINHEYRLLGRLSIVGNPNENPSGLLTLIETPFGSSVETIVETMLLPSTPGGHLDFLFQPIKKNWTWLIGGIWVMNPNESQSKTFNYHVRLDLVDAYGNVYPTIDLNTLQFVQPITVSVSDEKRNYANGALAALAVGLILGIFSFGAGAAAGQAIAAGLGIKALDPPEPDSRFKRAVSLPKREVIPKANAKFKEIVDVLQGASYTLALLDALGDTQNRLLGARLARDREAIRLQIGTYHDLLTELETATDRLAASAAHAVRSVSKRPEFEADVLERWLRTWQRTGIPNGVRVSLTANGCTPEALESFSRLLREPSIVQWGQDLAQMLSLLTYSLSQVAATVQKEADHVVAGG